MIYDYDVALIGSGHANWHAAVTLRQAGKSVVIIEKDTIAGTCTNYGCDPKILLDGPFELMERLDQYQGIGVTNGAQIDWSKLMNYKHQVIDPLSLQMTGLFKQMGIDVMMGAGSLTDDHTIQVAKRTVTADYIVLGTGQRSAKLPIPGSEYLHDSREFLDLIQFPHKITFIGAGIISLEFASMAIKLGAAVSVIEFGSRALATYHEEYAKRVVDKLSNEGVNFYFNAAVSQVEIVGDGYLVTTSAGQQVETDYVLDATGRIPNIENLGLEELGIKATRRGIQVDDHLRTSVSNIFASGDVIDKSIPKLTPTATFESNYIAAQILGISTKAIVYPVIPSVVFTLPRLAQVGVTIAEATKQLDQYQVVPIPYGKQMLFQSQNEVDAEVTLVLDANHFLVGAALYGNDAPELVNLLTLIINRHLSGSELDQMIFAFPSTSIGLLSLISLNLHRD